MKGYYITFFILKGKCNLSRNVNDATDIVIFNVFPLWNFSLQIPGGAKAPSVRGQGVLLVQYPPPPRIHPWYTWF